MTDFEIKVASVLNENYLRQCEEIAEDYHVDNGGTLQMTSVVRLSHYLVCAIKHGKVIGYAGVVENYMSEGDLYILQVAVSPCYKNEGIGSTLFEYIKSHSKGRKIIVSNVDKYDYASARLHEKAGFNVESLSDEYTFVFNTENIKNNQYFAYTDEESFLC